MGEVAARIIDATNDRNPERLRLLFASPHCLLDFSSGAAVATTLMLESLARQGFQCHAYCAAQFDGPQEASVEQMLAQSGKAAAVRHDGQPAPGQRVGRFRSDCGDAGGTPSGHTLPVGRRPKRKGLATVAC
jgi:hypothetical protein